MKKIFGIIRKRFLTEKKFGNYLFYGIGEIVLIVIGILIALQFNNWNESRKDRNEELRMLKNLNQDLKSASSQLDNKIYQNRLFFIRDSILLDVIQYEKKLPIDSLEKLILGHLITPTFDPEMGTIVEIINGGKLEIIKNDDLRKHISSWNKYMDELHETSEKLIYFDDHIKYPLYADKMVLRNLYTTAYKNFKGLEFSRSRFVSNPEILLNDPEFENMLSIYIYFLTIQNSRLIDLQDKINEMLFLSNTGLN